MRVGLLVMLATLAGCDFGSQCVSNCPAEVIVDAGVPGDLSPADEPAFCASVCPRDYKLGWMCRGADGGVLCSPKCPC